jgi:threonine dehydrogenase-like Zn-dependent dehydrogenase
LTPIRPNVTVGDMQHLMFLGPGKLEWQEAPAPRLESDAAAIVRPIVVATCDLDGPILRGVVPIPGPFAFGHEFIADVVEVGDAVRGFAVGDRVVVPFQISCGACPECTRGLTGCCSAVNPKRRAMYGLGIGGAWGGALADLVRVPFADAMLLRVPAGVPPQVLASASDNMPDAYRTVAPHLAARPGAPVLIVGGGAPSIGLYAVAFAKALGAERVDYYDQDRDRLAIAEALGGVPHDGALPARAGRYPITVDASSRAAGLACALRSTESWGVCTSVGIYYADTPLPLFDMYSSGVRFDTGRANARADLPAILELVGAKALAPERVTTAVAPWSEAIDALLAGSMKTVIYRDSHATTG